MIISILFIFFSLLKSDAVYVSADGSDDGDCHDIKNPCFRVDYAYDQSKEDEVFVYILDSADFPQNFTVNKSNDTYIVGSNSETRIPPGVNPIKPVFLLNISNCRLIFVISVSTLFEYNKGTVRLENVSLESGRVVLNFLIPFAHVSGFGALSLHNLSVSNFITSGLFFVDGNASLRIHNSVFNPTGIISSEGMIQISENGKLYVTYSNFTISPDSITGAPVIYVNSGFVGINNITILASIFENFNIANIPGSVLYIHGPSYYTHVYFDDNEVISVSTINSTGGGAIAILGGTGYIRILNNIFFDTHALQGDGGAVLVNFEGDTYFYNNIFTRTTSTGAVGGGAVSVQKGSVAIFDSNSFNISASGSAPGGGLLCNHQEVGNYLYNNTFERCSTDVGGFGGGAYIGAYWTTYYTYNRFIHNSAGGSGGGLYTYFDVDFNIYFPFIQFLLNTFDANEAAESGDDLGFNTEFLYRAWNTRFITACTSTTPGRNKIGIGDSDGTQYADLLPYPADFWTDTYVSPDGQEAYGCGILSNPCNLLEYALLVTDPTIASTIHVSAGTFKNATAIAVDNRVLTVVGMGQSTVITYTPITFPYGLFSVSIGTLTVQNLTFLTYKYYDPTVEVFDNKFNRNLFFVLGEGELVLTNITVIPNPADDIIVYGSLVNITGGTLVIDSFVIENITLQNAAAISINRSVDDYSINVTINSLSVSNIQRFDSNGGIVSAVLFAGNTLAISDGRFVNITTNANKSLGGVVYLYLQDDFKKGFQFSQLAFNNNSALYGTAIFVDALSLGDVILPTYFDFDWKSLPDNALVGYTNRYQVAIDLKLYLANGADNNNSNNNNNNNNNKNKPEEETKPKTNTTNSLSIMRVKKRVLSERKSGKRKNSEKGDGNSSERFRSSFVGLVL